MTFFHQLRLRIDSLRPEKELQSWLDQNVSERDVQLTEDEGIIILKRIFREKFFPLFRQLLALCGHTRILPLILEDLLILSASSTFPLVALETLLIELNFTVQLPRKAVTEIFRIGTTSKMLRMLAYLSASPSDQIEPEYFFAACQAANSIAVSEFIQTKIDIRQQNDKALQIAAEVGSIEIVKMLLSSGSDIHVDDDAIFCNACTKQRPTRFLAELLEVGANLHARQERPLRAVVEQQNYPLTDFLLANGADYTACETDIAKKALQLKNPKLVALLHSYGVDFTIARVHDHYPEEVFSQIPDVYTRMLIFNRIRLSSSYDPILDVPKMRLQEARSILAQFGLFQIRSIPSHPFFVTSLELLNGKKFECALVYQHTEFRLFDSDTELPTSRFRKL